MSIPLGEDDMTGSRFEDIAAEYGEEAAIQAGIAADSDTRELTEADFSRMRPASQVMPQVVEIWRRGVVAKRRRPSCKPQSGSTRI